MRRGRADAKGRPRRGDTPRAGDGRPCSTWAKARETREGKVPWCVSLPGDTSAHPWFRYQRWGTLHGCRRHPLSGRRTLGRVCACFVPALDPDASGSQGETVRLRGKEGLVDYRFFPEPDLPPLLLADAHLEAIAAALPELPQATMARLSRDYGIGGDLSRWMVCSAGGASGTVRTSRKREGGRNQTRPKLGASTVLRIRITRDSIKPR